MRKRPLCFVCLILILLQSVRIISGGTSLSEIPASSIFYESKGESVILKGQVYKKISKSNVQILFLKNNSVNDQKVILYDKEFLDIPIGKYIEVKGKVNAFEKASNPGGYDESLYYARQNIFVSVWAEEILEVSGDANVLFEWLYQLKVAWKRCILDHIGEENGGILVAMLLGDKSEMDEDIREMYQIVGISHVLAISGLHISFIGLGMYKLLRKTGAGFLLSGFLALIILTLYVLMIGGSVSAMRAYVMLLLKILADVTGRVYDLITATMFSATLTVCYQPLYLTDGGFYMSYGAILAIAIVVPLLEQILPFRKKIITGCYVSIAINMVLFPVILWFYYEIPTYSVLFNMLILPLTAPLLGFGIAGSIACFFWGKVGIFCLKICSIILEFNEKLCYLGSRLPFAQLVVGKPEIWNVVLYYIIFILVTLLVSREKKRKCSPKRLMFAGIFLCFAIRSVIYQPRGRLDITMLDVGQGDAIYFRGPDGGTYLIDGGSSDVNELGKYVLEPFLKSQGTGSLDYVFVTHGDKDHYSGIVDLLERQEVGVRVQNLVVACNYKEDDELLALIETAKKAGVNILVMNQGDGVYEDGLQIVCVQPGIQEQTLKGNAASMVLDITYGEFSMLCTGDVEDEGEKRLIKNIKKQYDVLKVAHHGSKYSTSQELLEVCMPKISLISSGNGNSYGHPHEELLLRLQKVESEIYNTQINDAIMLQTDGKTLTIW